VKYEQGNISDMKQADAFKAVSALEEAANKVATDMLSLDNTPDDFNPDLVNNVFVDGSKGTYAGHCVRSNEGEGITRLEATRDHNSYSLSMDGDHKEIRHRKEIAGPDGSLFHEEWAIFDGTQVKFKAITY